jgi:hypothetical protein
MLVVMWPAGTIELKTFPGVPANHSKVELEIWLARACPFRMTVSGHSRSVLYLDLWLFRAPWSPGSAIQLMIPDNSGTGCSLELPMERFAVC